MGVPALIITVILYLIITIDQIRKKDYPHAFIWFSYSLANIGFIWYEFTRIKNE